MVKAWREKVVIPTYEVNRKRILFSWRNVSTRAVVG